MNKILGSDHAKELLKAVGIGSSTPDEVGKAGVKLFLFMYGGNTTDSLACVRYNSYMKMTASGKPLQPERMPPTERAAHFHSLRVHTQIVEWQNLGNTQCDPLKWGWQLENDKLVPVMTDSEAGPSEILNLIRCKCKMTSRSPCGTSLCSCRKNGLKCVSACGGCHGVSCHNEQPVVDYEGDDNNDDNDITLS